MTERTSGAVTVGRRMQSVLPLALLFAYPARAAGSAEWSPASENEATLGDLAVTLASAHGGSVQALLLLGAALGCLLVGLQVLSSRS